ncbi:MAG: class II fructose-bisphosphate aldolase [Christensenellales bacterium]|jgi:ketose-bisphosphate aldolase
MALTNLVSILDKARTNGYAVPAFDVSNMEMIHAVAEVAEEEKAPAVFMLLQTDIEGMRLDMLINLIMTVAKNITVPVCIHLDHATNMELIMRCIASGVTSVMYDGSVLPFHDNIARTKEVVAYAHQYGVSVEAELGHVADAIGGLSERGEAEANGTHIEETLTKPEDARLFVEETGVDCLAVSIGTAHGVYVSTPTLQFQLLNQIAQAASCPLVLHGGSGVPDKDIQTAIALGITKINIFSEVLAAMNSSLKSKLNSIDNMSAWPTIVWKEARKTMREVIRNKIRVFGANGRG